MSKRRADFYLTKEPPRNPRPEEEDAENERDKIDPVQRASQEVMATRKLAKPRRNRFGNTEGSEENNGVNGGTTTTTTSGSTGGLFGGIKAPTTTPQTSTFRFSSTLDMPKPANTGSLSSNIFSSIKPTTTDTTTTDSKPASFSSNSFASLNTTSSLFPPNSPFNKFPPLNPTTPTVPSSFTPEMAAQKPPSNIPPPRAGGPIRTARHSIRDAAPQTPQPTTFQPSTSGARPVETPVQRGTALVRSNGDNVPIATPERNPAEPPEKHYWQRIRAMNQAFSEAVSRSIEGDAYCNLEWLFGQYKYWREEIERGYPYNPIVDSPAATGVATATTPTLRTSTSRLQDLKAGIAMKPPTPSHSHSITSSSASAEPFTRSQAPPPESQHQLWDIGSTQSTERTRSFGASQSQTQGIVFAQGTPSKTAETILGVLDSSGPRKEVGGEKAGKGGFSFGSTAAVGKETGNVAGSADTMGQGTETGMGTQTTVKPVFGSDMTKPFTFGASAMAKSSGSGGLGQGSPFPVTTSASKPFGSSFSTKSTFVSSSTSQKTGDSTPASPPKSVVERPAAPTTTSANRFSSLQDAGVATSKPEIITIDSDDDMVDDQEGDEMADDIVEEELGRDEEMEQEQEEEEEEEEEESDEDAYMLDSEDNAEDKDYVAEEAEEAEEEMEDEPGEEDVAKEVEELVKESPQRREKETTAATSAVKKPAFTFGDTTVKPFSFGATASISKPKEPEMSEIKPPPPIVTIAPSSAETKGDDKSPFRFGMPSTPSTFKPLAPITDTPSSALRKEFKFGLPSTTQKSQEKPTDEKPKGEEPPRRVTRSSSPAKRPAEEDDDQKPTSPVKKQRSSSPRKKVLEKEEEVQDTIEVKEPPKVTPFVFGSSKLNPEAKPFKFGASTSTTDKQDMKPPTSSFGDGTTKSAFSFGADTTKSAFTFGAAAPSTTSTAVKKDYTWTPDKPIKFDTPPQSTTSTTILPKPALPPPSSAPFTFGQTSSSSTTQPFKFGGLSTPIPASPKFGTFGSPSTGFGAAFTGQNVSFTTSPNLGFSFGQSPPATAKPADRTPAAAAEPEETGEEAAEAEEEPPVVSADVGTEGEEDEETVFSERAKLIQRLSTKQREKEIEKKGGNPNDVKVDRDYGVGVVRVNVHKETKRGRVLFRLEGSGRVVLNSYLLPGVEYIKQGKSMVLVPAPRGDGTGLDTFFVRVKDAAIAENLAKVLQEKKKVA